MNPFIRPTSIFLAAILGALMLAACEPAASPETVSTEAEISKPDQRPARPVGLSQPGQLEGITAYLACVACHSIREGAPHRVGPNLSGIRGQAAGTREGYNYSPALVAAGEAGLVWEQGTLVAWITTTEMMVPGTWMLYHNWLSASEIQAVAEFVLDPRVVDTDMSR